MAEGGAGGYTLLSSRGLLLPLCFSFGSSFRVPPYRAPTPTPLLAQLPTHLRSSGVTFWLVSSVLG